MSMLDNDAFDMDDVAIFNDTMRLQDKARDMILSDFEDIVDMLFNPDAIFDERLLENNVMNIIDVLGMDVPVGLINIMQKRKPMFEMARKLVMGER